MSNKLSNSQNTVVIFGWPDHEATEARKVAQSLWLSIADALTTDGKLVHGWNAYQATSYKPETLDTLIKPTKAIIFECSTQAAWDLTVILSADHHNPWDTGYDMWPDQFWQASSLGQLMNYLWVDPTEAQLYIAAWDHCPAQAYAGNCPGIDPNKFAQFRVAQKVEFYATDSRNTHKANPDALSNIIYEAIKKLLSAPEVNWVRDLRAMWHIDELPEAALATWLAYMTQIPDTDRDRQPTGNIKILIGGKTTPQAVAEFMEWANSLPNKTAPAYGNPTRGFAWVVVTL